MLLAGCGAQPAIYSEERFADDSPFKMRVHSEAAPACESARRVLLGQGYLIELANSDGIKARKAVKREDRPNTFIEMNIVCLPDTAGSTMFATGLLTTYALKKSSSSASVGVSALGSISLPIGQSVDSLVKVSEDTIDDGGFYKRFFTAISGTLTQLQPDTGESETPSAPEPVATAIAAPADAAIATEFTTPPQEPGNAVPEVHEPGPVQTAPATLSDAVERDDHQFDLPVTPVMAPAPTPVGDTPQEGGSAPDVLPDSVTEVDDTPPEGSSAPDAPPDPVTEVDDTPPEGDSAPDAPLDPVTEENPVPFSDPAGWHYDED